VNPYDGLISTWQRANMHAHGIAWGGLTSGRQPSETVVDTYRRMGYSVPGISNYHQIAAFNGVPTLPIYEHGYNILKRHQLAIGARSVDWFDFPLWQTLSHQQFVIDRVGARSDLVALAHPKTRDGYSNEDLSRLTGYHLLEVVNGIHRSESPWDAALSSGHAVWALANDDTHDLNDPDRTAVAWNMINAATASTPDVMQALRAGRTYAVMSLRTDNPIDTRLTALDVVSDGTVAVTLAGPPSTISFIGQNGALRKTVKNVMTAAYTFQAHDTYVRAVIESPHATMFLNPVMRNDGTASPAAAAAVNVTASWLSRIVFVGALAFLLHRRFRIRRERVAAPAPAVLGDVRRRTA
jgi:hypothetical protein